MTNRIARAAIALAAAGALVAASACTAEAATTAPKAPMRSAYVHTSFTAWGDSLTARSDSWRAVLASDTRLTNLGGYSHSGYTSAQVLPYAKSTPAQVTVVELGTNDVNRKVPLATTIANVEAIANRTGGERVVIMAGAPSNISQDTGTKTDRRVGGYVLNQALYSLAARHAWLYVDPYAPVRQVDNTFTPGTTDDGVHPNAAASKRIAPLMALAIMQAVQGAKG